MVALLAERGVSLASPGGGGNTVLHHAVAGAHLSTVRLCLQDSVIQRIIIIIIIIVIIISIIIIIIIVISIDIIIIIIVITKS